MADYSDLTFSTGWVLNEKWVILAFLGRGGMSEVYRAHQLNLDRDVAIKVVSHAFLEELQDDACEAAACLDRFRREVRIMAQVRHPNVLQVFDSDSLTVKKEGEKIRVDYIVMEYLPGGTLRDTMPADGFHPDEVATREWLTTYFLPLLNGVSALHLSGIVHRDLKPENVLLDGNVPKIADFGLARSHRLKSVTQPMETKGTPPYMSPEHFLDLKKTDKRADVYALGKILYEAVSGKLSGEDMLFRKVSLRNPKTPFFCKLDQTIQVATMENRDQRFPTVEALADALTQLLDNTREVAFPFRKAAILETWSLRNWLVMAVTLVLLISGLGFGIFVLRERGRQPVDALRSLSLDSAGKHALPGEPNRNRTTSEKPSQTRTLTGVDHAVLYRIPGGTFPLPQDLTSGHESSESVRIDTFYMDETQVTNHQYVEFLNQVVSRLKVENGLVWNDGDLWLMLGEIFPGYEPVVFQDGKFHIHSSLHATCPVLRVTAYGASAYASFFGRRLLAEAEWLYATIKGGEQSILPGEASHSLEAPKEGNVLVVLDRPQKGSGVAGSTMPMAVSPVGLFEPNAFGIRGLGREVGEWAVRTLSPPSDSYQPESPETPYVVVGGRKRDNGGVISWGVRRQPWEASEEAGFWCALSVLPQAQ